jgi:hypothetical protein
MEIGYGGDTEALPEETGRNGRIKHPPVATAPFFYSERFVHAQKGGDSL